MKRTKAANVSENRVQDIFVHVPPVGPRDGRADPVITSDWDSAHLTQRVEERKGEDSMMDDREEDEEEEEASSPCVSREDSCDRGGDKNASFQKMNESALSQR